MDKLRNKLCKVCSKKSTLKCGQCGKVSYCSRECQFKDWPRHKANCKYNAKNKIVKSSLRTKSTLTDKKKKTQITKKMEIENFLMKGGRKKRHCQTISIKAKSIPNFIYKETLGRFVPKRIKEDYDKKINEEHNNNNKVQDDDKIDFNFVQKFREILFKRENNSPKENTSFNDSESFSNNENFNSNYELKNKRIKELYDLLIEHRNFLTEKILLNSNRTYYFKSIYFMIDTYFAIEKYIINFIILIKYMCSQKDPLSLIRADKALNILGKELFNANNNNDGLLVFSLDCIFKRFIDVIKSKNIYQNINSIQNISKRFLYLISSIIKLSKYLEDTKMYKESLFFYISVFEMSLNFISNSKITEKIILRSNLKFNIGNICIKKKYLNTGIKLYKEVLDMQKSLDPFCFVCGVVYYNISIIYYVMDKIKESEVYLNEGIENLNKIIDSKKSIKQNDDFRRIIRLILVFYAELNLDRQNYAKAAQCLKAVIEIMIDDNQNPKLRHKTQGSKEERRSFKFLKHMKFMLGNFVRKSIISSGLATKMERELPFRKKQNTMSALECLYEIQYFNDNGEKVMFDENIKSVINGLFDKISFYYNEKLNMEKEKDTVYRSKKKKKTDGYKIEKKLTKRINFFVKPEILPDLDVKNILKGSISTERADITDFKTRARNKTIVRKKRDNILNEKNKKNKENKENENNFFKLDELKFVSKEINDRIISYLDDRIIKKKKIIDNEEDISDFKYFFLLLTTLSLRQIQILNNTQGINMSMELYKNLPILFSKQFKNSLNPSQRNMFNKLRVLSLIRCKVLKDAEKPITLDNINFNVFHAHINFNDFKLRQYSHIQEIIKEVSHSGFSSSKKNILSDKKNNTYIKLHSFNSYMNYNSKRISLTERKDENKHNKELFKNYIEQKIFKKRLQFDEDSYDSSEDDEEEGENMGNDFVQFRYRKKYDIKNLRKILIDKINNDRNDSEEEKELYLEIINSNAFIQLLNCLELKDIIEIEKNFDLIIDLLKFLENLRLKENGEESFKLEADEKVQKDKIKDNQEDNESNSSSSSFSNSINIDIDEKNVFRNNIRRATFLIEPKFFFDINNLKFLKQSKKSKKNKNNASSCVDIQKNRRKGYMFSKSSNQDNEKEIKSSKNLMQYTHEPFN